MAALPKHSSIMDHIGAFNPGLFPLIREKKAYISVWRQQSLIFGAIMATSYSCNDSKVDNGPSGTPLLE